MYQKTKMSNIIPNPQNARKNFKNDQRLVDSISTFGLQQPIVVTPAKEEGKYIIVAGERRYRACQQLKWDDIDCMVINSSDPMTIEIVGLVENVERQNLSAKEKSEKILELRTRSQLSNRELAKEVGVSEAYIRKLLKIDALPAAVKDKVANKEISLNKALKMAGEKQTPTIDGETSLFPENEEEMAPQGTFDNKQQDVISDAAVPTMPAPAITGNPVSSLQDVEKLIAQIAELSRQLTMDDDFIKTLPDRNLRQFTDLLGYSIQRIDETCNSLQDEINDREENRRGIPVPSVTAQQNSLPAA